MSSNYKEPLPDPNAQHRRPTSELWGPWGAGAAGENRQQQQQGVPPTQPRRPGNEMPLDAQFVHREHVTGSLASHPSEAPAFRPAYSPYPQFPGYQPQPQGQVYAQRPGYSPSNAPSQGYPQQGQAYPPYPAMPTYRGDPARATQASPPHVNPAPAPTGYAGYNGYAPYAYYPYAYAWQPPQPKRDGYLLGVAISALVGSSVLFLGGLLCLGFLALYAIAPRQSISESNNFAAVVLFISFALAGLLGGVFGLYHSIRSVFLRKPSADFSLPQFWIFVLLYLVVIGIGFWLKAQGQEVAFPALTIILIMLAGIFPSLTVLALGVRLLHFPRKAPWPLPSPTSWRRFTLALISGATLSIALAAILELALQVVLVRGQAVNPLLCFDRPNAPGCQDPSIYNIIFIMVAVIAPFVEETVKPLAVVILIGRVRSAAEAFVLGLACGIGFDLIETTGYISSGYHDWLDVALTRSGAGLLHGFGAAMVALGWYYITHAEKRRLLLAAGCWSYAVLQHALWNGSWGLILLPAPVGSFFNTSNLTIGPASLPSYYVINIVELIFMLAFFIYMTGKLRTKAPPSSSSQRSEVQPAPERQFVAPT